MNETSNLQELNTFPDKKPASLYYRYAAASLDGLIVGFITLLVFILLWIPGNRQVNWLLNYTGTFVGIVYSVVLLVNQQATWGKQYFKMKVETADGQPILWGRAVKREVLGRFLSSVFFGLGYLWALFDKRRQSWHDKIAGTVVVEVGPLSKGRKFVAFLLVFGLAILAIMGIIAVIALVSLNPQKQLEKAREMQRVTEEKMSNDNQENKQNFSPVSEQLARAYDAGRISGVQQMGRATQAYYVRNQNYPNLYNWSIVLVSSGELVKIPDAINYANGSEPCSTNLVNGTWCYNSNTTDTIVFAKLESQQRNSNCKDPQGAYVLFSVAKGRGGVLCSQNDPEPLGSYTFVN